MARGSSQNTTEIGNRLERKAFAHFEALGFRVEGNLRLKGAQTDLVLWKQIPGFGQLRVIAEVKYLKSGSVKRGVVESFLDRLRNNENVTAGVIISNRPFSLSAKDAVASNGRVNLLTIDDLSRGLLNYDSACVRHVMEYEAGNAFNTYTAIAARLPSQKTSIKDVAEYLTSWAIGGELGPSYLVSGDFGSGKTTTLERIRYDLCRNFIEGVSRRFPVLLRLRLLLSHSSLVDFVRSELLIQHHVDIPSTVIEMEITGGSFVLLLDGFDEINTAANAEERAYYIQRLGRLLAGHCPCIIATRPTYFESLDEMKILLLRQGAVLKGHEESLERRVLRSALQSFDPLFPDPIHLPGETNTLELRLWGPSDIATYLKSRASEIQDRLGISTAEFQSKISKVYNLSDLISRPLLLAIIVDTIVENGLSILDHASGIGPSGLYAIYLKACAQREAGGRKTEVTFSFDERLEIARRLAVKMLEKGSVQLSAEDITTVLQAWRRVQPADKSFLNRALTDIRVCTFLSWANDDSLRFAHLSYLEFFVAQKIYLDGLENPLFLRRYSKYRLSSETIAFLGDFARTDESFRSRMALAFEQDTQSRSQIAGIAIVAGCLDILSDISNVEFSSLRPSRVTNKSAKLSNVRFDDVTFVEAEWRSIRVLSSSFARVRFFECHFDRAILNMHGREVGFTSCDFNASDLCINGEGFVLEASKFSRSCLTVEGFCRVSGVSICDNSVFRVTRGGFDETSRVSVSDSVFIDEMPEVRFSDFNTGSFQSCKLLGLTISSAQARALLEGKESSVFISHCSGVLVVDDLAQDLRERLKRHFPELTAISSEEWKIALERDSTTDERQKAIKASIRKAIEQSGIRKHATGPWATFGVTAPF